MSMSKKLTFSLASLVLIIGLVFATAPVMAQEDVAAPLANVMIRQDTVGPAAADADERFTVIGANVIENVVDTGDLSGATGIPDLEERLLTGTTIALLAPAANGLNGLVIGGSPVNPPVMAKDVIISEIMWALNTNAANFTGVCKVFGGLLCGLL